MDYQPDLKETGETAEQAAPTEKLSPGGIAAIKGETEPGPNPDAPPAEPAPDPDAPAPVKPPEDEVKPPEPTQPPAYGEKGMADRIEKKDIGEREYYPSVSGERGG